MRRNIYVGEPVMGSMDGLTRLGRACLWCLCLSVGLSACQPTKEVKREPTLTFKAPPETAIDKVSDLTDEQKDRLVSRVEEKWHAMERRDFGTVYEYTTPNYRKVFSKRMFLNKFGPGIRWELTGVDILNYDAEAAVATVGVRVITESTTAGSPASGSGKVADTVKEQWLLIDGEWWNNAK
jgi:hypothetical protein